MEDQNKAKHKFENALFVIDELNGELYHSLKFSNEVSSNESKQSPVIREKENRIKSFTFDVGHLKLEFSHGSELMISETRILIIERL